MTNSSFRDGVQFAWDATSITAAMTCPRKYYYSMIAAQEPQLLSVHLLFGQRYATALEHFYKHRADGDDYDTAVDKVVEEALITTWDTTTNLPVDFAHSAKTRLGLLRSIVWYLEEFAKDEADSAIQTHHLRDGKPAVEVSFTLDMSHDVVLCGHLDRIVTYSGDLYIMDQKTSGNALSGYFFDQFKPDNQMSLYTFVGQIIVESPIKGVIIDGAQILVGSTQYARGFTHRTKPELEEWWMSAQEVIHRTKEYSLRYAETQAIESFPMNVTACGNYGGCPFRRVCSSSPSIRTNILKTDYQPRVWDPLERR